MPVRSGGWKPEKRNEIGLDININDLKKYDTEHAKKGDTLISAYRSSYSSHWAFSQHIIKSVSAKRGDITFDNGKRFDCQGRRYGKRRYDTSSDVLLEFNDDNVAEINTYVKHQSLVFKTRKALEALLKNGCSRLDDMPTEKIEQLYETVKDFVEGE